MTKKGLDLYIDGDWLRTKDTTLDADDGIALAYTLALFDSPTLRHPHLELICTVPEETDMGGAHVADMSMLKGNRMLDLDSDEEGIALASCAGDGDADITLSAWRVAVRGECARPAATSFVGGYSGMEVGRGRASVALLLARVLTGLREDYVFRLVSLEGGAKYNMIAREASAGVVLADSINTSVFREAVKTEEAALRREYAATDPSLSLTVAIAGSERVVLTEDSTKQVPGLTEVLSHDVQRMSADIDGPAETSVNLGITKLEADKLTLSHSVRSSIATAPQAVIDKLELVSSYFGTTAPVYDTYPAWGCVRESAFRDEAAAIHRELSGKELSVQVIRAGLECGILSGKIKNLDAVSIGSDIKDIHTPGERLNIPSTKRVCSLVAKIIEHKSK